MLDVVIIGAGIAGQTAAIYAARKRMNHAVLAEKTGGQMMESGEVLNYPGIVKTTGWEFASILEKQSKFNGVKTISETVKSIKKSKAGFVVTTDKNKYETLTVIIATGARPRHLNVPGEKEYRNKGVAYCTICDGPLFKGADVAIIGGGNSALEASDFMANIAKKIYILNIGKGFTAHEYLVERVKNNPKFEIINSAETKEIKGNGKNVTSLVYTQGGKQREIKVEGVFIEAGRVPNTEFAKGLLKVDKHSHIVIDCETNTSVPGIFAAGDCASGHEYQYVIAAGQGCMALIKAARHIASTKKAD